MHIYLRAAVSVAGEQNPQIKAHEMERDVLAVDDNGVVFFLYFEFFQSPWMWDTRHCWHGYPYQV